MRTPAAAAPAAMALALACACGGGGTPSRAARAVAVAVAPTAGGARPEGCRDVAPGALAGALAAAAPGDALCLRPGVHPGPIAVARPVVIWGPRDAVVRSTGQGTTIAVAAEAAGTRLLGFSIDGSGGRYDQTDSAVAVRASDAVVAGLAIDRAVFGITVERAARVEVRGNEIHGDRGAAIGLRGDAIRLWETTDSRVADNDVRDGRDLVFWYSPRSTIQGNRVSRGRYGTHLMYSHDSAIAGNRYDGDVVGVFIMYSRGITLTENVLSDAAGAAGVGIGLKDSGNIVARGNRFVHDAIGLYVDSSPLQLDQTVVFDDNLFRRCDEGIVFLSSPQRASLRGNTFADDLTHVRVDGGGDALGATFDGNYFDDYAGYDLDEDGVGDLPYEPRALSSDLLGDHPDLRFFRGAPALALIDAAGHVAPLYPPRAILRDARPRMSPPRPPHAR